MLKAGLDPNAEKIRQKVEAKEQAAMAGRTFKAVALEWLDVQEEIWAASNYKKKLRLLEILFNAFGDKPITELVPADILAVLKPIDACGKTVTAHALAQTASQVCRYARACGYCTFNAADGLNSVLRPIKSKPRAALLNPADVGRLLRDIDNYQGSISVMFALKILPFVALRSTELRGAAWAEIDIEKALWTVPASRKPNPKDGGGMKMRQAHEVPLSRQTVELFKELRACCQSGPLCFPSPHSNGSCISDMGLLNAIRRMGYGKEDMTIHGFRTVFSTFLNEKKQEWGFDADAIERQLAHSKEDKTRAAYDRADYLEQRTRLMQVWADYLDDLRAAAE